MNGIHDLGGMHGFGAVIRERDEPNFHHAWERRVFGLFAPSFAAGLFCVDEFRHAIERMGAAEYLQSSYYEHWLHAIETLALEKDIVTAEELRNGHAASGSPRATPALAAAGVPALVETGASARVDTTVKAKFAEGDMVVVKNIHPVGHTRLPRYCRDKLGCIDRDHGVFVFPDSAAHGKGEKPQHCYSVYFSAQELWGSKASRNDSVYVDLWDDYLLPA
ncbi:MAG: nitrile hydratase subunit beta [Gammaproteobacteria bacterium]